MEDQLVSLSAKFQDATATRMAATTQRAVHENMALTAEVARLRQDVLFQRNLNQTQEQKITILSRDVRVLKELLDVTTAAKKPRRSKEKRDYGIQTNCDDGFTDEAGVLKLNRHHEQQVMVKNKLVMIICGNVLIIKIKKS